MLQQSFKYEQTLTTFLYYDKIVKIEKKERLSNTMKKVISLILTLIMIFSLAVPAVYAAEDESAIVPIIYIRGNGEGIYYENGAGAKAPCEIDQVLGDPTIYDIEGMKKEIINILIPFVLGGLAREDWDECRKAIYTAISPFFQQCIFDADGNPQLDTDISVDSQQANETPMPDANYTSISEYFFSFHYDWRRSPYDHVDELDTFVDKVLALTGAEKVSFVTRCLGGNIMNAYLDVYGDNGKIKNILFGDTLANGSTTLSKILSGKLSVDGKNTQRYLGQLEHCAEIGQGVGFALPGFVDEVVTSTLDMLTQVNVTDKIGNGIETLYNELLELIFPALLHATGYATMPNYWACVREEDYDDAMLLLFGEEGSEAQTYYAGLIDKIERYRENITKYLPEFYNQFEDIHIGTIAKYGYLNMSLLEDNDILSDALASLEHATFGATCAKVGTTLSDSYIADKTANNLGKYISPDKQVDVSTALFPDTTWVVKNCHHNYANIVFELAKEFCTGTEVTIDNCSSRFPQFMVYDESTTNWTEMTAENSTDFDFMTAAVQEPTTETRIAAAIRFLTMLFKFIGMLFSGEISFGEFGSLFG